MKIEPGEQFEIDCWDLDPSDHAVTREALLKAGFGAAALAALAGGGTAAAAVRRRTRVARPVVGEGKTIALHLNGFNVYDQCLATGVLKALAGTKYKFIGAQGNFDSKAEVTNVQNLLSQKPSGLLIIPNTVAGASRGALQAKRMGIPVVNLLWSGKTPADSAYIGVVRVNNTKGGIMIADYLGKTLRLKGEIVVVIGVPGQGFSEEITKGIKQGLVNYPELKIADIQPGFFTAGPAQKAVQNMLTAHPNAVAIVDYAAEMGNGIAQYLKARHKTSYVHVTSDGNEQMLPWLREGKYLTAVRYYSSAQEGLVGAQMMRNYLEHNRKPKTFVTELYQAMVTKKNLSGQPILCYDRYESQVKKIA